ncbi:hypothetical protein [Kyrpidia sp.]|uniref:hypothetical protein n=1 Tax=Kyrpidia sp. TaxID=2073077 RepID=UPI0025860FAD|nr:hypothetical protein [Kyrpidia sp.]MCL6576127.1 hypothetical protein [Kyrpidia sp.]
MDALEYVRQLTVFEYSIDRSTVHLGKDRRWLVIPRDDEIRHRREYGVYVFFDGDRCLYVGESSPHLLVGRALDYLWKKGGREWLYRIIWHYADRLFIIFCGAEDELAGLRMEAHLVGVLEPVLNENALFATPEERIRYGISVQKTKLR